MKEYIVLGNSFVKFTNPNDNEWVVNRVVDLDNDTLQGIVDRAITSGKVIYVYDRHNPKDTREIVGEVEHMSFDNGIKTAIKWNDLGTSILEKESRYPSVELRPCDDDESKWDLIAIAMVGEPASKDVDILELSALENENKGENRMDDMIKELVEGGIQDPEKMRIALTEMTTEDPTKISLVIDAFADTFSEMLKDKVEVKEEVEGEDLESEEKRKVDEGAGFREADRKDEDVKKKETSEERKEDEGTGFRDEDLMSKEKKDSEELTALAYEHGAEYDKGVPTAESLRSAIDVYLELAKTKLSKTYKQELAFKELKFVGKKEPVQPEDLSALDNNPQLTPGEEFFNFLNK